MWSIFRAKTPPPIVYNVGDTVAPYRGLLVLGGYVEPGSPGTVTEVAPDKITVDFTFNNRPHLIVRVAIHPSFIHHVPPEPVHP